MRNRFGLLADELLEIRVKYSGHLNKRMYVEALRFN